MKCNSSTYYSRHNLQYNIYFASKPIEIAKIVKSTCFTTLKLTTIIYHIVLNILQGRHIFASLVKRPKPSQVPLKNTKIAKTQDGSEKKLKNINYYDMTFTQTKNMFNASDEESGEMLEAL